MKMRPPAIPLITVDPYFSVWSASDKLYDTATTHWTGSPNTINGFVIIDDEIFRFMGKGNAPVIQQVCFDMSSLITNYIFANEKIILNVDFYSSLFTDDLYRLSRPASYMKVSYKSNDKLSHNVKIILSVSEEICLNKKNEKNVITEITDEGNFKAVKIGSEKQTVLSESGDDIRIDWGYFYLTSPSDGKCSVEVNENTTFVTTEFPLYEYNNSYVIFAYDDIKSIDYFGDKLNGLWKKYDSCIIESIKKSYEEAEDVYTKCISVSDDINKKATACGGEKYADLLSLAYRQLIAAHKLVTDTEGKVLFISKECFSNGCAATVDVTYPSSPFFLLYNTELLKGMLRPIFKFAVSDEWKFDFAPHDVGQYPLILGQVYGKNHEAEGRYADYQMPVEECGNMLIMVANITIKENNTEFFDQYSDILASWVKYLEKYGMDPENQLCTDDFAGHLAHNCNLSLKAIMGIAGYSLILRMKNDPQAEQYMNIAKAMADNWIASAANSDGSFRLTFDRPDTFSMKYNMVWDKLWHTNLFAPSVYYSEFCSNKKHINAYGMPLDNRRDYTKSDWLLWTACLAPSKEEFEEFIAPMWNCYNVTPSRVPMTDWYDTVTSLVVGFRHRSVQGGLFIKLLENTF